MFRAVVVTNETTDDEVKLKVRYHRKHLFADKRRVFEVKVPHGSGEWLLRRYLLAKALKPGDELFVDEFGEDWCDPSQRSKLGRWWYLNFA